MTKRRDAVREAQVYFDKCVREWLTADKHCQRTFAIWNDACERRVRFAIEKNNAWGELEMAKAAARHPGRK